MREKGEHTRHAWQRCSCGGQEGRGQESNVAEMHCIGWVGIIGDNVGGWADWVKRSKESELDCRRDKIESVKGLVEPGEKHALLEDLSAYLYSF